MEVVGLLLRVACVFSLLFLSLHLLRRVNGLKTARRAAALQVLGSTRLGKGAALTVVRIGDSEYVLGVTDHSVTLIAPATSVAAAAARADAPGPAPADAPAATTVPAAAATARPDFAAALGARLGALGSAPVPPLQVAPTPAEFLRSAYRVARRRPAETTDLSHDAVCAALANVRGDADDADDAAPEPAAGTTTTEVPAPRTSPESAPARTAPAPLAPRTPPVPRTASSARTEPAAADGPAAPTSRHALRRAVARTDALRHEEHLWTRSCRPTSGTAAPGLPA